MSDNPSPSKLFLEAFSFIEENSIVRDEIDWESLSDEWTRKVKAFGSVSDAHNGIKEVLRTIDDGHSFLWTSNKTSSTPQPADDSGLRLHQSEAVIIDVFPNSPAAQHNIKIGDQVLEVNQNSISADNWHEYYQDVLKAGNHLTIYSPATSTERSLILEDGFETPNPLPMCSRSKSNFGIIDLPGHLGDGELPDNQNYISIIHKALHDFEAEGLEALIIDLRRCDGGNMWPMLAALTPILGKGKYGYFIDPIASNHLEWRFDGKEIAPYEQNADTADYAVRVQNFRALKRPQLPIAVLISEVTSSSGEIILMPFLSRPKTKIFGLATGGLMSSNSLHTLSDGSWLLVKAHWIGNAEGNVYKAAIEPDYSVDIDWVLYGKSADPVILAAEKWLQNILALSA